MKIRILLILIQCILLLSPVLARSACHISHACDSLCRTPLLLHFRFDHSLVEYDYMDNPHTLEAFDDLFSDSLSVSLIDTLIVTSYASPDGNSFYNRRLAHLRAVAVKGYLVWKYPYLDQYRILIRPQGEDWEGLRQLVNADTSVPDREDVLAILDDVSDHIQSKILLRRLNCGYASRYINRYLLPKLRNAAVCTIQLKQPAISSFKQPDAASMSSKTEQSVSASIYNNVVDKDGLSDAGLSYSENIRNNVNEPVCVSQTYDIVCSVFRHPLIALKTNFLTWVGITPDGKLATFRPNLAAEVFFARRWSMSASASYSHWKGGKGNQFWGVSGYSLEPRFWFNGDGTYRWLYLGAYGQLGDFDYRPHPGGDADAIGASSTGTYWSAGLSLGIYVPLTRHLGFEAGVRSGYRCASGQAYDNEPPHDYYHHDLLSTRWGITGLNFSLTYRWLTK